MITVRYIYTYLLIEWNVHILKAKILIHYIKSSKFVVPFACYFKPREFIDIRILN